MESSDDSICIEMIVSIKSPEYEFLCFDSTCNLQFFAYRTKNLYVGGFVSIRNSLSCPWIF